MTSALETLTPNPEVEAERRRALRALLCRPLLTPAETPEDYIVVRRHTEWLKQWLTEFPAWSLHIDRDLARLRKIPPDLLDETRPAIDRTSGICFSKRRYALLCLALAGLEQSDRQTTLAEIAHAMMELAASDPDLQAAGMSFDIGNYDQRRDLVHVVRFLIDMGLLRRLDGDERQFLNRNGSSDVLYEINRRVLAAILNVSRSASSVEMAAETNIGDSLPERVARLIDDPMTPTEDASFQRIRARLVRALLDDPILYFHDLNDEERVYLDKHRGYLLRQIHEATGLIAEIRREGIAMVDDDGDLTDLELPENTTEGNLSLFLVQWFAQISKTNPGPAIPVSAVEEHVRSLIQVHGSQWRKEVREAGAEAWLTQDALSRLRSLRLIQIAGNEVVPLAACGRYAAGNSLNGSDNEE